MRVPVVPDWPGLAGWPVSLGGVTATVSDAAQAADVLASSRSSAIAALLRAAGNPLSSCDYWAAAAPYLDAARSALEPTGQRGCAGRHVAKTAFCEAACEAVSAARQEFLASAAARLSQDHRIAAAMACDAVTVRRRAWASAARRQLRDAVDAAVRECRARPGMPCVRETACGTGDCPFASSQFSGVSVPAGEGKRARPPCHASGGSFSEASALEAWLGDHPYRPMVTVTDHDVARVTEQAA